MTFFKKLISKVWFFPLLMLLYGLRYVIWGEKLPANLGYGWDGIRYGDVAVNFLNSPVIDSYFIFRILPSSVIHFVFKLFDIPFVAANVIRGFEIINLISLTGSVFILKLIMEHFKILPRIQLVGFILFMLTQAIADYVFYYPALTDASAVFLCFLLLYFFIKKQDVDLILVSVAGAFTLPLIFYMGLILLVFPFKYTGYAPVKKYFKIGSSLLAASVLGILIYYFVIIKGADSVYPYTLKIDRNFLAISIGLALLLYSFFPQMVLNRKFFSLTFIKGNINILRITIAVFLFLLVAFVAGKLNLSGKNSNFLTAEYMLQYLSYTALIRPLITLTSHLFFFGPIILFLVFFWRRFTRAAASFGPGPALCILLVLLAFGLNHQSRILISTFPFFIVFLLAGINKIRFSKIFIIILFVISFLISRIYITINFDSSLIVNKDEPFGFPNQWFYMNLGQWVSEPVYLFQLFTLLYLVLLFTYFLVFHLRKDKKGSILIKKTV